MSKRNKKKHGKSKGIATKSSAHAITTDHSRAGITSMPATLAAASRDPGATRRWILFTLAVLLVVGGWGGYAAYQARVWPFHEREEVIQGKLLEEKKPKTMEQILEEIKNRPRQEPWKIEAWKPASEDDKLIDRFMTLHNRQDKKAADLLAPLPAKEPANEAESEQKDAGAFLRMSKVRILKVWRGEPDPKAEGKPRPAAGKYVLVTKGGGKLPSGYMVTDPFVVVEVKGQSIQPLRTAAYSDQSK